MKCIMCGKSKGSIIYGLKQNYLVCSECLKKYKPELESKRARKIALQLEIEERVHKYMLGV